MTACPDREELERLVTNRLAESVRDELEMHVEHCAACQQVLDRLTEFTDWEPTRTRDGDRSSIHNSAGEPPAGALGLQRLGDYRILRAIGRGGMGVVYEAEQESLGRRVALKVLSAGALADPKQVRRFEREAKAAARLHHTNIVPVFGVGEQDGHHYLVMQFIAGPGLDAVLEDLRQLRRAKPAAGPAAVLVPELGRGAGSTPAEVARSLLSGQFAGDGPISVGPTVTYSGGGQNGSAPPTIAPAVGPAADPSSAVLLSSAEGSSSSDPVRRYYRSVALIGIQVAVALEYANRQGILHRDVKPSNLLLDNRGNVWVADFGLAKTSDADDLTHTGDILGILRYMAPERFQGKCDARSDVYSLGLTLYEMVALRPAYEASDQHALIERVLHEEPERLKKLAPGLPRDLETIIAKASAREPAGRYATAAALAEDLKRFVEDRPIRARRVSAAERLARWCRRNPRLAVSMGVAATALFAALVLSLLYANRQAQDAAVLRAALSESDRRLAMRNLERGRAAFEKGHVGEGMVWTVEALRMATEARDENWKRVARANLSAWRRHLVELKGLLSHGDQVSSLAFSLDGKTILTGSFDRTARLWDAETGRPIGEPLANPERVFSVAFSPDGRTILTGCGDGTARLWDAATRRPSGGPLKHMDVGSVPLGDIVSSVAFSPDGRTILTGGWDNRARLWDAATGRSIDPPLPHPYIVNSVAFSPDGLIILTGCGDGKARLWNAATGQPLCPPLVHAEGNTTQGFSVAFRPDGRTVLTGCWDTTARRWDAHTGQPIGQALGHADRVNSVAFRPDGQTILTGCVDGTAQLWDAATGRRIGRPLGQTGEVSGVAFSPDTRSILIGSTDGTARLWDCRVDQPIHRPLDYGAVVFGPDGKTILTAGSGQVQLREIASGRLLGRPVDHARALLPPMALSPDGRMILIRGGDTAARLWEADTGQALGPPLEHPDKVGSVAFSPDGRTILTGCNDGTVRLWDAATRRQLGKISAHQTEVISLVFSPDGRTILAGGFTAARLLDAGTGRPIGPPLPHRDRVDGVAFSPDGKVALTGSFDKSARLWDARTGEPIGPPLMHQSQVWSVAFSPDGRWILTGTLDGSQLWDAATFQPIGPPILAAAGLRKVAFSRDGRFLLTGDGRYTRRWDAPVPLPQDVTRLTAWVEAATGLELDERGAIRPLDRSAWLERRSRLEQLGGSPPPEPAPRLDSILFGPDPAARGDAWRERYEWDRAETAYLEALHARPLNATVRDALVRLHVERGHLDRAVATLAEAVRLIPDDLQLRAHVALTLLASGNRAGWQRATNAMLDRFGGTTNPFTADRVACTGAMGPGATADPGVLVRLAEIGVRGVDAVDKPRCLNTLAAALYRAGRYDEAISRLEMAIRLRGNASLPEDWPLLALAHHRLGHRGEARRWLDELKSHQPSANADQFWKELWIRLLRGEAEAVIVYDPVFPDNPFAP
jgi:WD40 repeat protein/serine/threonine protein kinase/tetratricopeptide (TPR) repeat protein